ncbi:MAG: ATPase, partial [Pseudomonadota bacterium]
RGDEDHTAELVRRFDKAPKPMSYQAEFLTRIWAEYLDQHGCAEADVDPDSFIRWTYAQALAHRQPRYQAMARNWGVSIAANDLGGVRDAGDFDELIERTLEARRNNA